MKVLVIGPSASGKSYISRKLKAVGINAFDAEEIEGLENWYNRDGKKVPAPATADEALNGGYAFLWSRKTLTKFLARFNDVFVFGGSGNVVRMFDLFDRVYCLQISPELQRERLCNGTRPTPQMDAGNDGLVIWGDWFEKMAREQNIPLINADQTPEAIYQLISQ